MKLDAPELWSWVAAREQSMRAQLAGTRGGFVPGFRDPDLLPGNLATAAPVGVPVMAALDLDGDGLLSEAEAARAVGVLMGTEGSLDRAGVTKAVDRLLNAELRRQATPERWAKWVFKLADADKDGRVGAEELMAAFRRHLAGVDRDYDGMVNGREIVEAFAGAGLP
jgi:Ca2+-binding EF-hand superfamily protein